MLLGRVAENVPRCDVFGYLCDYLELSQTELAARRGIRREQVTRWMTGTAEPTLGKLRSVLEPLGWAPVLTLRATSAAVEEILAQEVDLDELLGWHVLNLLGTVAAAAAEDLDVVVGGEVAAVLQGVPLRTEHLVIHVRDEHRVRVAALATARGQRVGRLLYVADAPRMLWSGPVGAELRSDPTRPATRMIRPEHRWLAGGAIPVVPLAALLGDDRDDLACLGPSAREVAGRFTGCGG